ncbi:hypothetical protein ACFFX0_03535 [Citricoccus parietis]|uniref:Uncharacterized protein n=1 Tax=Citricoccus parietis TaxID=592307 RepID=A0ABV5FUE4_9MICC
MTAGSDLHRPRSTLTRLCHNTRSVRPQRSGALLNSSIAASGSSAP